MNAATQALSAALYLVDKAAANGQRMDTLRLDATDVLGTPLDGLDGPLAELTGDELLKLADAATVLTQRARATEIKRRTGAASAEIQKIKAEKGGRT